MSADRSSPVGGSVPADPDIAITHARWSLALLSVIYTFNFVDRQILSILIEPIERDLGVSDSAMGFLTGFAFAVFYTFAGIPIARWADRGVRRDIIAIGLALWSGMTVLSGLARSYAQLALARVGVGVGEAACTPAAHSMIADLYPRERRASAMAIYSIGIHAGILFGFLLGGKLNEAFGWRNAFFVVGLPGVALALVARFTMREPARASRRERASDPDSIALSEALRTLWKLRTFRHMSFAAGLTSLAGYAFLNWNATFLIRVHGMQTGEIGAWLGLISGLGGALGTILGGVLADRLARKNERWQLFVPAIGVLAALPFYALYLTRDDPRTALLFLIPAQVLASLWFGPVFSLTQGLVAPRMRALASSVLLFIITLIGLGLGPQIVGWLNDLMSERFGSSAIRISLLVASAFFVWAAVHYFIAAGARSNERGELAAPD